MENIDWQYLLFSFEGRINRARFWIGIAAMWVILSIFAMLAAVTDSPFLWTIFALLTLLVIWPSLAVSIKRWHDRGKSGW